jgi:hypothetical protein
MLTDPAFAAAAAAVHAVFSPQHVTIHWLFPVKWSHTNLYAESPELVKLRYVGIILLFVSWGETESNWYARHWLAYYTSHGLWKSMGNSVEL